MLGRKLTREKINMRKIDRKKLYENVIGRIKQDLNENVIGGASVILAQNGEVLLEECCGYSDVEKKIPLTEGDLFRLASMTKPVTAVAALIAEERGYFSLSDPISKYFPEFLGMRVGRLDGESVVADHPIRKEPILRDFLTHTSGFMCVSPLFLKQNEDIPKEAYESLETMVEYCLKNTCLTFDPCEATGYGAYLPFDLVAYLVEKKSGMKYADFVNNYILYPLNIKDITYNPTEEQWGRVVKMCDRQSPERMVNVDMGKSTFENFPLTYTSGGAGFVGNAREYLKFAEMLRRGGEYEGVRIISEDSARKLHTPYIGEELIGNNAVTAWGLSVQIRRKGYPNLTEGSYGWSGAYGTHFFIDPENELVAIYLKNTRWYDSHGAGNTGRHFEADVSISFE